MESYLVMWLVLIFVMKKDTFLNLLACAGIDPDGVTCFVVGIGFSVYNFLFFSDGAHSGDRLSSRCFALRHKYAPFDAA